METVRDLPGVAVEGRIRSEAGVIRPLWSDDWDTWDMCEATEAGRDGWTVVGAESLEASIKTPHLGGHEKYSTLYISISTQTPIIVGKESAHPSTDPSFFPIPLNPPSSSTPAQTPSLNCVAPRNLKVPSIPIPCILTLSPTWGANLLALPVSPSLDSGRRNGVVEVLLAIDILLGVNTPPGVVGTPILGLPPIDGLDEDLDVLGVTGAPGLPPRPKLGVRARARGVRGAKEAGGANPPPPPPPELEWVGVSGSPSSLASSRSLRILLGGRRLRASWR